MMSRFGYWLGNMLYVRFLRGRTIDRLRTENHLLKQALWDTQKELAKHRLLLADLANADKDTEEAFKRAQQAVRAK